jgi:hypothetical protein
MYSDPSGNIPFFIKVGLIAGVGGAIYEMIKYIKQNYGKPTTFKDSIKGLGIAVAKGFVKGFVVGMLSCVPGAYKWGLVGGTIIFLAELITGKVKNPSQGIKAFLNGWTIGVVSKGLSVLTNKITALKVFSSVKDKEIIGFVIDIIGGLGVSKLLSW